MRRRVMTWVLTIAALFVVYIGVETILLYHMTPTLYSTVKRLAAKAPEIQAYGETWTYMDTVDIGTMQLTKFTKGEGEYKDQMYYIPDRPGPPGRIYVHKQGTEYYTYTLSTFIYVYFHRG